MIVFFSFLFGNTSFSVRFCGDVLVFDGDIEFFFLFYNKFELNCSSSTINSYFMFSNFIFVAKIISELLFYFTFFPLVLFSLTFFFSSNPNSTDASFSSSSTSILESFYILPLL